MPGGQQGGGTNGGEVGEGGGEKGGSAVQSHTAGRVIWTEVKSGMARRIGWDTAETRISAPHCCSLMETTCDQRETRWSDGPSALELCRHWRVANASLC